MDRIGTLFSVIFGLFFLSLLVYIPSFNAPFQLDDYGVIVGNPLIAHLNHPEWLFEYDPSRFLTHMSFALNYRYGQFSVIYYHTFNFVLHLFVTFLVFAFIHLTLSHFEFQRTHTPSQITFFASMAAVIFMIHPIQTSAVTYIAQRATILASLFYLSSLIFYILSRRRSNIIFYILSIASAVIGLFCKPIIFTLPLSIVLYEVCFLEKRFTITKTMALRLIPYVLVAISVPILLMMWKSKGFTLGEFLSVTKLTDEISRKDYLLTQFNVLVTYLRLLILPINQNLDYDYPISTSLFQWPTLFSFSLLLFLIFIAVRLFKTQRVISFGMLWFFVTLSLESSIFPITDIIFEHRLYLPMLGFALIVPIVFQQIISSKKLRGVALCLMILYFGLLTLQRNIIWSNKFSLLLDVIAKSPNKSRPYNSLGLAYAESNMYQPALDAFNKALERNPNNIRGYNNRATLYRLNGEYFSALKDYDRVLTMDPKFAGAYYFRALTYQRIGHYEKAIADAKKAMSFGYPNMDTYINSLNKLSR